MMRVAVCSHFNVCSTLAGKYAYESTYIQEKDAKFPHFWVLNETEQKQKVLT